MSRLIAELIAAGTPAPLIERVSQLTIKISELQMQLAMRTQQAIIDDTRRARNAERMRKSRESVRTLQHSARTPPTKEEKSPLTLPSKEENYTPSVGRAKRATRLPEEWKPSEEAIKFANNHGWLGKSLDDEIIKFHNYWVSKSGQNATKCSWERTWQNWILNAGKPKEGLVNGHHANPAAIRRTSDAVNETLARRQERFRFG